MADKIVFTVDTKDLRDKLEKVAARLSEAIGELACAEDDIKKLTIFGVPLLEEEEDQ